jgi:hypothetical protein
MITGELFPVPLSATVCGLPVALSAMLSVATSSPVAAGVKVTPIVQLALAAKVPVGLHAFVPLASAKLLLLVPVIEKLVKVTEPVPVLATVTLCAALVVPTVWLAKVKDAGEIVIVPACAPTVPVNATVCGLPVALSAMLMAAVREPVAVGLKVTLIVQLASTASDAGQVFVSAKSPEFVPVRVIPEIAKAALPPFVKVTVWAALVVPMLCELNVKLVGARMTEDTCAGIDCTTPTCGRTDGVGSDADPVVSKKTASKGDTRYPLEFPCAELVKVKWPVGVTP